MNFILINPLTKTIHNLDASSIENALMCAGLARNEVDHGTLSPSLHIIVYEFGLVSPKTGRYFSIAGQLFNGPAVVYGVDPNTGHTIDIPHGVHDIIRSHPTFTWYDGPAEVETAITECRVMRPQAAVNGRVVWKWNQGQDKIPEQFTSEIADEIFKP